MTWDKLSMKDRAAYIKLAVENGISDLNTIRSTYEDWKTKAAQIKDLQPDEDATYDYEGYYNEDPQRAWDLLNDKPEAHFVDTYKTAYHPSFSNESKYSGYINKYNPLGIEGGTWIDDHNYRLSESQMNNNWDVGRTIEYLEENESNGASGYYPDGSRFRLENGEIWGGVLPEMTFTFDRKTRNIKKNK